METLNFIPETMKRSNRWCLRRGKEPFSALYRGHASCTDAGTLCGYETAVRVLQENQHLYDGLMFSLFRDDRLCFVDLDHIVLDGVVVSRVAKNILERFRDEYTELSLSGTGIHIICCGSVTKAIKTNDVEIYCQGRFVALTGQAINTNEPTKDRSGDIETLRQWLVDRRERRKPKIQGVPTFKYDGNPATVDEVIRKASNARNGAKFMALYSGEWESLGIGDGSQSSADLAFANLLAYWSNQNVGVMTEIFRQSGMFRNDRKMNLAIAKALN